MRPIQSLGASPEGLQQFLWLKSRDGILHFNPRMLAMEFGMTLPRFETYLEELESTRLVVDKRPGTNGRLRTYQVSDPGLQDMDEPAPVAELREIAEDAGETLDVDDEFDVTEHRHRSSRTWHIHAWGSESHHHFLGSLCRRPECEGCEEHGIHSAAPDRDEDAP